MKRGKGTGDDEARSWACPAALALAVLALIIAYWPVLAPLLDGRLLFTYGDFWTAYGGDSASLRSDETFFTFFGGTNRLETNRFYPLAAFSALAHFVEFSDAQFISALILASMTLGCIGLYGIAGAFIRDRRLRAAAILALALFYFLNLWSVERIGHIWIWFAYAVFPLYLFLGLKAVKDGRDAHLMAYSLVLSFFGIMPHAFMYLLFFHAFLAAFAMSSKNRPADILKFAIMPLAIYAFINLPSLILSQSAEGTLISGIHSDSIGLLSRNGGLANLFAFSNNWWHQVGKAVIYSNPAFTYSSMGIFAVLFLGAGLTVGRMGADERRIIILALAGMLAVFFVAQGANNQLLAPALESIAKSDFSFLLRPLREWARISLLLPPLMAIVLAACINDRKWGLPMLAVFSTLVAANIAVSPAWPYLYDVHTATNVSGEIGLLQEKASGGGKDIWPGVYGKHLPATTVAGEQRDTSTYIRQISGIYRGYNSYVASEYENSTSWKVMPPPLMDALDIRDVILMDGKGSPGGYAWMDCSDLGQMMLCQDARDPAPFRIYEGVVSADAASMEPMFHIPMEDYVPTSANISHAAYTATGISGSRPAASGGWMLVIEAESGLGGRKYVFNSPGSSNRTSVYFAKNLTANVSIPETGEYGVAILGKGVFNISASGNSASVTVPDSGYAFSRPIRLEKGPAVFMITNENRSASLDAVVIYEITDGAPLGPFTNLTAPPARLGDFTNIGPTDRRVEVSAQRPFVLSFAETYDPQWIAEIFKDGRQVGAIKPISLYDTMNGYRVNETGELEIRLIYEPQERYMWAMVVSMAAIAACIAFLALSLRKEGASHGNA